MPTVALFWRQILLSAGLDWDTAGDDCEITLVAEAHCKSEWALSVIDLVLGLVYYPCMDNRWITGGS